MCVLVGVITATKINICNVICMAIHCLSHCSHAQQHFCPFQKLRDSSALHAQHINWKAESKPTLYNHKLETMASNCIWRVMRAVTWNSARWMVILLMQTANKKSEQSALLAQFLVCFIKLDQPMPVFPRYSFMNCIVLSTTSMRATMESER